MKIRNQMKTTAVTTENKLDQDLYREIRISFTTFNKNKKKVYFDNHLINKGNDSKKNWNVLNQLTAKKNKTIPSFLGNGMYN